MTREIILTRGKVALVDDDDYDRVNQFSWFCSGSGYAARGSKTRIALARFVLGVTSSSSTVDHINGDTLDNRKENLREITQGENSKNRGKSKSISTSRFKGVYFEQRSQKWIAAIYMDYKRHYLGSYVTEEEAAKVYNAASREFHGEFGRLNKIEA